MNQKHRLYRTSSRNIVLQRRAGKGWKTIAHCGNNPASIQREVTELAVSEWIPDPGGELADQIEALTEAINRHAEGVARLMSELI